MSASADPDVVIALLMAVIEAQDQALRVAAPILGDIGASRSKYADDAWIAYSLVINAVVAVQNIPPPPSRRLDA
jgi:hypothetical protein